MRKSLAFGVLLGVASLFATAAPEKPLRGAIGAFAFVSGEAAPPAKTSDSPVSPPPVAAPADGITVGHRLIYKLARAKAASALAKKENISREAAREKIDDAVDDAALHAAVQAAGVEIKPQVSAGKLSDFLGWLAAHQDAIMAIVKIILALFGL